jgi:hypothetical protein
MVVGGTRSRQTFFARIEKLIDEILFNMSIAFSLKELLDRVYLAVATQLKTTR